MQSQLILPQNDCIRGGAFYLLIMDSIKNKKPEDYVSGQIDEIIYIPDKATNVRVKIDSTGIYALYNLNGDEVKSGYFTE